MSAGQITATGPWAPGRCLPRGSRGLWLGGVRLRWRVRRHEYELDCTLAAGVDPMESDELSLRVGQLGSAETRMRLARALRGAAALASRQPEPLASRSGASEIQASRALLLGLAEAVGGGLPVGVEGLAKASLLVSSSSSPLYHAGTNPTLAVALHDSLDALHRGHRTVSIAR